MEFLNKMAREHPLLLAMLTDLAMIIPFVDFIITVPMQWALWSELDNETLKYINMSYDLVADFIIPVIGDLFPLNTVSVICVLIVRKVK